MNRYNRDPLAEIEHWKRSAMGAWCAVAVLLVTLALVLWRVWP